ncbi:MAG: tRNA lysidine(34) synthetase TilS [Rhodospirillales bacterium]|nr:tRNA lysidine(34) synthetase TilS [Rhodospirillales bacterium]
MASEEALGAAEFAAAMAALGPWEARPRLAVAVSGGSDSLALAMLVDAWARARGAALLALVVDHGLRPESAIEAEQVRRRLDARGIVATILHGAPDEREGGSLQERARRLRYGLLLEACIDRGIPHILLGHHRDDQAETVLMRLVRGSGLRGLAAMAPATLAPGTGGRVRLLRPLLGCPKARLRAVLETAGQAWVEDPSNADPRHERVCWRGLMPVLEAGGVDAGRLTAAAARLGQERAVLDRAVACWLAATASPSRYGHISVGMEGFSELPSAVAEAAFARLLSAVGGGSYPPRRERLARALDALRGSQARLARTLAGCVLTLDHNRLLVTREPGATVDRRRARPGVIIWDGRFELELKGPAERLQGLTISCLGPEGLAEARRRLRRAGASMPKAPARQLLTLPALWQDGRLVEVPHFPAVAEGSALVAGVAWAPRLPLTG